MLEAAWYRFRVQRTPWNQTERAAVSLGKGQFLCDKRDARAVLRKARCSPVDRAGSIFVWSGGGRKDPGMTPFVLSKISPRAF